MATPVLAGVHHLKIPVGDLEVSVNFYQRVFGAEHLTAMDHFDAEGSWFAALLTMPGVPFPIELRWAPAAARGMSQCDVLVLAVDAEDDLRDWITHLDACGTEHSPLITGPGGSLVVIVEPDAKFIRLTTAMTEEAAAQDISHRRLNPQGPWLDPPQMRHPRTTTPTRTPFEGTPS